MSPGTENTPPPAVIIGDDVANSLGLARNLGRAGIDVHRIGSIANPVLDSRYIRSTTIAHDLEGGPDEHYIDALAQLAGTLAGKPVLFPVSDLHVIKIARNAAALNAHYTPVVAQADAAETLVNKRRFHASLLDSDILHPQTFFPANRDEFIARAREIGYPVLIKPEISPLFYQKFRCKAFVARTEAELLAQIDRLDPQDNAVMLQEIIPGGADCLHGCAGLRTADRLATFCFQRVREFPAGFGAGSHQVSIPSFVAQTRLADYLADIGYHGVFEAEFKRHPDDGGYRLIEINARSWWQNTHPTISGMNLILAAYRDATGQPLDLPDTYATGTRWIHLYNDYHAARREGLGLWAWLRSMRGTRTYDIWATDDKQPMLSYTLGMVRRRLRKSAGRN